MSDDTLIHETTEAAPTNTRRTVMIIVITTVVIFAVCAVVFSGVILASRNVYERLQLGLACSGSFGQAECDSWTETITGAAYRADLRACRDGSAAGDGETIYAEVFDCLVARGVGPGSVP